MRWHWLSLIGMGQLDLAGSLLIPTAAVILDQGIQGEQTFEQPVDPLAAIPDRAFGGDHQLGDARVGMAVGSQPDDALVGLDRVSIADHLALREAGCLARLEEHAFQHLVREPVQARGVVFGRGRNQPFVGQVAAIVQGGVQGERTARFVAQDFYGEVLLGGLASTDEAEENWVAVRVLVAQLLRIVRDFNLEDTYRTVADQAGEALLTPAIVCSEVLAS